MKIALATSDGKFVSKHFGNTPCFLIAEVSEAGWEICGKRDNVPACRSQEHSHSALNETIKLISDCGVVICSKIGNFAQTALDEAGIVPLEKTGFVNEILSGYSDFLARKKLRFNQNP